MPYQNPQTPRFYIDIFSWLKSLGLTHEYGRSRFGLDTSEQELVEGQRAILLNSAIPFQLDYFAILGHEMAGIAFNGKFADSPWTNNYYISNYGVTERINCDDSSTSSYIPTYNGFSLVKFNQVDIWDSNITHFYYQGDSLESFKASSFSLGKTYDMPHSDLKITMSREMDGVKRIRTKGGNDLVKHQYTKPPQWGNSVPWELSTSSHQKLARVGRRTWDMSFTHLQDSDVFPVSELTTGLLTDPDEYTQYDHYSVIGSGESVTPYDLLGGNTFYNQVIHKTNGGQLPFLFNSAHPDNNIQNFAICKFDMNSFSFQQTSSGLYSCKLKIREVW